MSIRLIASDLDGTLIGPDLVFSSRLLKAVRRAQEQGITVTSRYGERLSLCAHLCPAARHCGAADLLPGCTDQKRSRETL